MNTRRATYLTVGFGFLIAMAIFGGRVYQIKTAAQSCQALMADLSAKICSPQGELQDWAKISRLVAVKLPVPNVPFNVYHLKSELQEAGWIENPGWFGFRPNCIYEANIAVQNSKCGTY
ncbi:MAG: hypothetical protein J7501_18590 [Bdellovibrio sp.]|nr:hypothetical protein [Bdellovibrio sp.]